MSPVYLLCGLPQFHFIGDCRGSLLALFSPLRTVCGGLPSALSRSSRGYP